MVYSKKRGVAFATEFFAQFKISLRVSMGLLIIGLLLIGVIVAPNNLKKGNWNDNHSFFSNSIFNNPYMVWNRPI
jgi:hypothetical protein